MTTPNPSNKSTVVITGCDYYLGNEMAHQLLLEHGNDFKCVATILSRPERGDRLKKAGAEIRQINYQDENTLVKAFEGEIDWVLLIPDAEDNRVQNTKMLVDAMQKAGKVCNVAMFSPAGADTKSNLVQLREFKEMENYVKEKGKNYVFLRSLWINNVFHLWSKHVMEHGQFPLTLDQNQKFAPLQIEDVVEAVHTITCSSDKSRGTTGHIGKTYILTGPEKISGPQVVESLNRAIGEGNVQYQTISREELQKYLQSVRGENERLFPGQPTDKQIQTYLDEFDWIKSGEGDIKTDDLKKLTGHEGQKVEEFFKRNSAEFGGPQRA